MSQGSQVIQSCWEKYSSTQVLFHMNKTNLNGKWKTFHEIPKIVLQLTSLRCIPKRSLWELFWKLLSVFWIVYNFFYIWKRLIT